MPKHGKRYRGLREKVDRTRAYSAAEAVELIRELATAKFDETVEVHFRLGIDPRKSDQNVRGTVALPHGTGKSIRVLAIVQANRPRRPRPLERTSSVGKRSSRGSWAAGWSSTPSSPPRT